MKTIVLTAIAACIAISVSAKPIVSLKGSPAALAEQNHEANREHLKRYHERQLPKAKMNHNLVPLPNTDQIKIDHRLGREYRWVRQETRTFLMKFANAHYQLFHRPLVVTSAVRTFERQALLKHVNPNAARGDTPLRLSAHLTGAATDVTKKGMSQDELKWMRRRLLRNERAGCAQATEEFRQPVFHIMPLEQCFATHVAKTKLKRTAQKRSAIL